MVKNVPHIGALKAGETAKVAGVRLQSAVETSSCVSKRLADMGFVRGAALEMVKPGAPCIVRVGGVRIGLGRDHQSRIIVG
ncbi:MAG: FeoA family protein [Planctomycetota bacterium]|jgi:Fe2+ transport system protein FeoA